ncbi:MAG: DNA repair protein RecN [Actinobacteria bacterium]|nr:DNA repair protein RecN [Actinomycetota bacterium]
MRIRGLGVIDDAVLALGPGLTVVTGETGAGKTMVVQGLSLLFGGRAEAGRVRPGNGRALVEGRLVLTAGHAALDRAVEAGAELDDGALLISRSVAGDGRSRAHLGGAAVPVGVLGQLAEHVLAVHGQSDQHRLLQPARQRAALDRYAGPAVLELRDRFAADWGRWRQGRGTLDQLRAAEVERNREAELLRLGLVEVEAAEPAPGEGKALIAEIERLAHADDLRAAAAAGQQALTGDETAPDGVEALGLVVSARRRLESAVGHDAQLGTLAARLTEIGHLLTDVAGELASYLASVDADPARLSAAQERLALLTTLVRRYGAADTDGVLAWAQQASDRLLALDGAQDRIAALEQQDSELEAALGELAGELSAARTEAARRFGAAVTAELAELAMPHAEVRAAVSSRELPHGESAGGLVVEGRLLAATAAGVDDVELLLRPHPGSPPRPLHKGASGGELSRVMLAVEVVFAGSDPVPLLVFDEVDAGVGGRAAVEVGRRLARLARDHQVVVVTHLPQVAAFADRHLLVVKADNGTVTTSGVVSLEGAERVAELSRMLAGVDTGLARGHAEELLAVAAAQRRSGTRPPA